MLEAGIKVTEHLALARSNVRRSFRLLQEGIPPFSSEIMTLAKKEDPDFRGIFGDGSLSAHPVIYRGAGGLHCAQDSFFGFYLLCQSIRSCLSAMNFLVGGQLMAKAELYGPASGLFYTAAYHAVTGLLAANGRVLIDQQNVKWIFGTKRPPQVVAACLTRENNWSFEGRGGSHVDRWLEFKSLFVGGSFEIPAYFRRFFSVLYPNWLKPGVRVVLDDRRVDDGDQQPREYVDFAEILTNREKYRAQIEDYLDEFLKDIAQVRHEAIYRSFGDDPGAVEAMFNGEAVSRTALGHRSTELGLFSQGLLADATDAARYLMESLQVSKRIKLFLYLGCGQPWMDKPRSDFVEPSRLKDNVEHIWKWLMAEYNRSRTHKAEV